MNINSPQQNYGKTHLRNQPSFQANVEGTPAARKALKTGIRNFYNTCSPEDRMRYFGNEQLNPRQLYSNFTRVIETATNNIKGTIRLFIEDNNKKDPQLSFISPDGKVYHGGSFIAKDISPKADAVRAVVAKLSDAMANEGKGWGNNNPFHVLFEKHMEPLRKSN